MVGESHDMRLMAAREAVEVARAHPDTVIGIKVRVGANACGRFRDRAARRWRWRSPMRRGLPLMAHIDEPPPSYGEVVSSLRPGDVLTHCFRPFPNAPMDGTGRVRPEIAAARERGVIFDVAHGKGSFSWKSARAMLAQGFRPDVLSSDVHALCIDGPAHDNLRVMTKFLALGWSLPEVVEASTVAPARALRRGDLGHLKPGAPGDVSVFRVTEAPIDLEDVEQNIVPFDRCLEPVGIAVGGRWRAA